MVGVKMAAAAAASIRERQTVALKRMLNFNVPHVKNNTGEPVWKVLIFDRFGQDIISPLLSVKELRDMGITLHLLLHSDRDPIPDVPAVYFVMPTEENIDRMGQDLRNQLYESYYLNFISAISRSKLEDIANAALAANAVTQVAKGRGMVCSLLRPCPSDPHSVIFSLCSQVQWTACTSTMEPAA